MGENQDMPLLRSLNTGDDDFEQQLDELLQRDVAVEAGVEETVRGIIERVRREGDTALLDLTRELDQVEARSIAELELSERRLDSAFAGISPEQRIALEHAAARLRDYHQYQRQESWQFIDDDNNRLGQKVTPILKVGIYVPGGKASYPSSVLMNAIPAKVAGVGELVMVSPTPHGEPNEMVLAAAKLAGVDRVFCVGGAQAVAALAWGTETIPAVDKIVGPGNIYVATAKRQVFGQVGIDMIAGPSEILLVCDDSVDPDWAAMDLFAQAEHDELSQSILLTTSSQVAASVREAVARLIPGMTRRAIIERALRDNGAIIVAQSTDEMVGVIDRIAPEHLELLVADADEIASRVANSGAIFIGPLSAESLGDYCAGPNHVLPTSGTARFSSPLGVYDFQKRSSIIEISAAGADVLVPTAATLARAEGLDAHARSAEYRRHQGGNRHGLQETSPAGRRSDKI